MNVASLLPDVHRSSSTFLNAYCGGESGTPARESSSSSSRNGSGLFMSSLGRDIEGEGATMLVFRGEVRRGVLIVPFTAPCIGVAFLERGVLWRFLSWLADGLVVRISSDGAPSDVPASSSSTDDAMSWLGTGLRRPSDSISVGAPPAPAVLAFFLGVVCSASSSSSSLETSA